MISLIFTSLSFVIRTSDTARKGIFRARERQAVSCWRVPFRLVSSAYDAEDPAVTAKDSAVDASPTPGDADIAA
jgi:hypothetical protein